MALTKIGKEGIIGIDNSSDATAITIDSSENVGIGGITSLSDKLHLRTSTGEVGMRFNVDDAGDFRIVNDGSSNLTFISGASSERMRIDSSGNLLVGKTSTSTTVAGIALLNDGRLFATGEGGSGHQAARFTRLSNDGDIVTFYEDGTTVGSIGVNGGDLFVVNAGGVGAGLRYNSGFPNILPCNGTGADRDNAIDLGHSSVRFDDVYATNGTIQTSDQQEKNTITDSDLGIDFIKRLTPKSYIFNGKTRTHYGLIAQDVETVLSDISKPTSGFAGFIKDDISEEQDGSQYRYGLRYTEFVAPLIQAVKDQQATIDAQQATITALEARIEALENA